MPTINRGDDYFQAVTYTGNGSTNTITGLRFQPDFVWVKGRSGATDHALYDAVRGTTKDLVSNSTAAETTQSTGLTSFNSDGFTLGALSKVNTNAATYVAWCWKANGAGSSNTSGSITSTVSVNTTSGFSIVTYTGTGANATVGHGLGVAPRMIIVKNRASVTDWAVYHASVGNTGALRLNLTAVTETDSRYWNNTTPTSTVFSVGSSITVNGSSNTQVAYCWAAISGYSAFGSYTGNGSADGPFVYLGFRPKFVLIKYSSGVENWAIWDTSRNTYNVMDTILRPDSTAADTSASTQNIDFVSNGFKIRGTDGKLNTSSGTYIYAAFAENPFKNANAR